MNQWLSYHAVPSSFIMLYFSKRLCANTFFPILSSAVASSFHELVGSLCSQTRSISVLQRCTSPLWLASMFLREASVTLSWMPRSNHSWPLMSASSLESVSILHVPGWNVQWPVIVAVHHAAQLRAAKIMCSIDYEDSSSSICSQVVEAFDKKVQIQFSHFPSQVFFSFPLLPLKDRPFELTGLLNVSTANTLSQTWLKRAVETDGAHIRTSNTSLYLGTWRSLYKTRRLL